MLLSTTPSKYYLLSSLHKCPRRACPFLLRPSAVTVPLLLLVSARRERTEGARWWRGRAPRLIKTLLRVGPYHDFDACPRYSTLRLPVFHCPPPRRLPSPLLLRCLLFSYSAPPCMPLSSALLRLAPPCPPPNTPPHASRGACPCCSTPCATASLTVYHRMARASGFPSSPHPTVSSLSQSFAHTLTHTHSSPRLSRALSIVPFTYLTLLPPPFNLLTPPFLPSPCPLAPVVTKVS
jgi:hypothetical protein